MDKELFSELEDLGFDNIDTLDLFNKEKKEELKDEQDELSFEEKEKALLYNREVVCPVCGFKFKVKTVKKEGYRVIKRDTDSFVYYLDINPYFYDVWLCNHCGYATMESDFFKLKSYQVPLVAKNISTKWQGKTYPELYDANIAIERFKLALLNYYFIEAPASKKAMTCLKLAWMYRILDDDEKEISFLKQAVEGFEKAYFDEDFPIYKIDKFTFLYLLGELNRRIKNHERAYFWFSQLITAPSAPQKLKEKARDQKELIEEAEAAAKKAVQQENPIEEVPQKKDRFLSKFFRK